MSKFTLKTLYLVIRGDKLKLIPRLERTNGGVVYNSRDTGVINGTRREQERIIISTGFSFGGIYSEHELFIEFRAMFCSMFTNIMMEFQRCYRIGNGG